MSENRLRYVIRREKTEAVRVVMRTNVVGRRGRGRTLRHLFICTFVVIGHMSEKIHQVR